MYVGDQAAYGRYEQMKFQQDAVLRQEEAAAMNETAATEMNMTLFPDPYFY